MIKLRELNNFLGNFFSREIFKTCDEEREILSDMTYEIKLSVLVTKKNQMCVIDHSFNMHQRVNLYGGPITIPQIFYEEDEEN